MRTIIYKKYCKSMEPKKYDNTTIPIEYQNGKYFVPFSFLEENKGKENIILFLQGKEYRRWEICFHHYHGLRDKNNKKNQYDSEGCHYNEKCWKLHIKQDFWTNKDIYKKGNYKKKDNNNTKNNGNDQQEKLQNETFFPVIVYNKVERIPIQAVVPTKRAITIKEKYDEGVSNDNDENFPMISEYCPSYAKDGFCKYGKNCNRIHILHWFMEYLKNRK